MCTTCTTMIVTTNVQCIHSRSKIGTISPHLTRPASCGTLFSLPCCDPLPISPNLHPLVQTLKTKRVELREGGHRLVHDQHLACKREERRSGGSGGEGGV